MVRHVSTPGRKNAAPQSASGNVTVASTGSHTPAENALFPDNHVGNVSDSFNQVSSPSQGVDDGSRVAPLCYGDTGNVIEDEQSGDPSGATQTAPADTGRSVRRAGRLSAGAGEAAVELARAALRMPGGNPADLRTVTEAAGENVSPVSGATGVAGGLHLFVPENEAAIAVADSGRVPLHRIVDKAITDLAHDQFRASVLMAKLVDASAIHFRRDVGSLTILFRVPEDAEWVMDALTKMRAAP